MEQYVPEQTDSPEFDNALAEKLGSPEMRKAGDINERLTEAMRRRLELIGKLTEKTE